MSRMDKLEEKSAQQPPVRRDVGRKPDQGITQEQREVVCYRCGQEDFTSGCTRPGNQQIRETRIPWGDGPDPKGSHKGN